jgi:hypothetical protein
MKLTPLLVYAACPSRMADQTQTILEFIASRGHAPLHPFQALPYAFFEGGLPGREKTLEWCCRLIDICDEFWLFGLSDGTLFELRYLLGKGRHAAFKDFSGMFDEQVGQRKPELADILSTNSGLRQ